MAISSFYRKIQEDIRMSEDVLLIFGNVYLPICKVAILVMLIHPFDELYTIVIVSVYKTGMSCTLPENPFGIRDSICHCLSYKWRAKIRNTAADQRRYLDFSKSVNVFKVLSVFL